MITLMITGPKPARPLSPAERIRRAVAIAAAAAAAMGIVAACGERTPMLNSERIEATYGNYGIEVLAANESQRIANLYSVKDGRRTTRTYAEVRFSLPVDQALREEHALIVSGRSIGEVFKSRGWTVEKRDIRIGSERLDAGDANVAALMRIDPLREVALHEYALVVVKNGRKLEYAVILERHHPDYLSEADLEAIY